jgi:hypothetical protein
MITEAKEGVYKIYKGDVIKWKMKKQQKPILKS